MDDRSDVIDSFGWYGAARPLASPNCDDRPADCAVELLLLHNISLPPNEFGSDAVLQLFTNSLDYDAHPYYAGLVGLRLSAHFFIRRDGAMWQFVPCTRRAWHAGVSHWRGRDRCNDFSIGVELEGADHLAFDQSQYAALDRLTAALQRVYPLVAVAGHSDVAPDRKTDPGPHFDWSRCTRLPRLV